VPAEIKVISSTAMKTTLDQLAPEFERASGHKLVFAFGPSIRLTKEVAEGAQSHVTLVTAEGIEELIKKGKVVAGSRVDLARSATAVAVKQGARKPDISTAEKFKQAMLAAKSLAMSNPVGGGASGAMMVKIFERLGIAPAMHAKTTYGPGGPAGLIGNFLVRGEAEIGIQQVPELMAVPGIDIVGPLPDGLQVMTIFSVGLSTSAQDADAGRALIKFLTTPAAAAVMKTKGMEV
jgi:molybdate transport system substrate-binding protein